MVAEDPQTALAQSEYEGKACYFCAPGCKKQFEPDPARYVK